MKYSKSLLLTITAGSIYALGAAACVDDGGLTTEADRLAPAAPAPATTAWYRFARVDRGAAGKVTTVAQRANARFGLAGQRRPDPDRRDTRVVDQVGTTFVDQLVLRDQHFAGQGNDHIVRRNAPQDPFAHRHDDLTVIDRRRSGDGLFGAAVVRPHDAVLCHVDQTAGQVARVPRLRRGVGPAFPSPVGRV